MTPRRLPAARRLAWVAGILMVNSSQAGVWGVDPVVGVTGDYATNPALVDAPDTAATSGALLLDAPTTYYTGADKFSLLPSFRLGDTRGYSSTTSDYEHLTAKGEFDTERSTLTGTAGVARDSSLNYDYLSDGATGVRRDSALTDVNFDRYMTERLEFDLDANATRVRYGETSGVATLVDYKYISLSPMLAWNTAERNKYTLTTSVGRYNSLDGTTESRNGNVQLGFSRKLSEQWSLTASGGYSRALNRIFYDEEFIVITPAGAILEIIPEKAETSQNGSIYSVNLSHQGSLLLLNATASRQIQPTGFAFLSRQQSYELTASYTLSPRWTVSADVRQVNYVNPLANGDFYSVKVPYASVNASWLWTEHWTVTLGASHVRETVQAPLFDQQSQELTLTLSRRFNHIDFQ
jgi:hypothetical protein